MVDSVRDDSYEPTDRGTDRDVERAQRQEAEALLLLQRLPGLGDRGIGRLVAHFGCGRAALDAPDHEFAVALIRGDGEESASGPGARAGDRGRRLAAGRGAAPDRAAVAASLERADACGVHVVPLSAPSYPARLLALPDPPPVLFLRGLESLLGPPAAAIVGSRRASEYGLRTAARFAAALAQQGVVVVSGFALGIDGEAHRAALDAGGGTIAVMGAGPDVVYPRAHSHLLQRLVRDGLLVTEFPSGTAPAPHHFPRRNRIMAALAGAVVVVEATERSGALITARHALDLGREVLAVPGPIDSPSSAGTNGFLRDGAHPALGAEEILRALGLDTVGGGSAEGSARASVPVATGDAAAVLSALEHTPAGVDDVAARSGLEARRALVALSLLELDGWAIQCGGARFARRV